MEQLTQWLFTFGELVVIFLEFIGVMIIFTGGIRALYLLFKLRFDYSARVVRILLGESLSMALEFKLGAEIIRSMMVQTMAELAMLGVIVAIRIILSFVIHWEVKGLAETEDLLRPDSE